MVEPVGLDLAETRFNYFVGDQENWHADVRGYEVVAYESLYDGIDLLTWGQRDSLKYEFHVAPGADYRQIQVSYDGIDGLWLDDAGELHVQTDLGELIDEAPYIYQQLDGQQVEVAGDFALVDAHTYTFTITGNYDASTELVIDPDLAWPTYLGGSNLDAWGGIAVDAAGNALVSGATASTGWVSGGFDTSHNGGYWDGFVAKLSPSGGHLWSTYLGGDAGDYGWGGIAVDAAGNALVTGLTDSPGWVSGGFDTSYNDAGDGGDGFVVKLSPSGGHLWSTYLGGSASDRGEGIAVDAASNALVTGKTYSPGWVSGGFDTSHNGNEDAFVVKLSPSGGHLWSTYLGGSGTDEGFGIAVDAAGNALVTGQTISPGWVSGGFDTSFNGGGDMFVARITVTHVAAEADAYDVEEDQTLNVPRPGVLINDSDGLGHVLTVKPAEGPSHGTLALRANGSFTYRPNEDFHGTDSFTYRATDGDQDSKVATVTLTVHPVNDPPQAIDDTYTTDVNMALSPVAPGLLDNDQDIDADTLTPVKVTDPQHALFFQLNADGSFVYVPQTDHVGPDRFTYKVTDGQFESNVATVTIAVGAAYFHPGDEDLNGYTALSDFNIWNAHKFMQGTAWTTGDFNDDGITDLSDFNIWNAHKFTVAVVPAPIDVALEEIGRKSNTYSDVPVTELAWLYDLSEPSSTDRPSGSRSDAAAQLAWLCELEQSAGGQRTLARDHPTEKAVDALLRTYWPQW